MSTPASPVEVLRAELREAISNAYYGARNDGETMEYAADRAVDSVFLSVEALLESRWQQRLAALQAQDHTITKGGLDAAYRERNAVVAALIRVGGYPAQVVMAPDTEGWWIVYAETPQGQVSWHVSPDDMDLFSDVPVAFGTHHSPWDGHTTEEKYRRVAALEPHP